MSQIHKRMQAAADRARKSLARTEALLRHVDAADDAIGEAAERGQKACNAELKKQWEQIGAPVGADPDQENAAMWLAGSRRRLLDVQRAADVARKRRA